MGFSKKYISLWSNFRELLTLNIKLFYFMTINIRIQSHYLFFCRPHTGLILLHLQLITFLGHFIFSNFKCDLYHLSPQSAVNLMFWCHVSWLNCYSVESIPINMARCWKEWLSILISHISCKLQLLWLKDNLSTWM